MDKRELGKILGRRMNDLGVYLLENYPKASQGAILPHLWAKEHKPELAIESTQKLDASDTAYLACINAIAEVEKTPADPMLAKKVEDSFMEFKREFTAYGLKEMEIYKALEEHLEQKEKQPQLTLSVD